MANRDTGLWSKLQERLKQPVKGERPAADVRRDVTAKVKKVAGELRRRNQTAAKTTRAAAVKESEPMKRKTKTVTKKRPTRTAAKSVRAAGRKTAKRRATAAYSRTARVGRNEDTQLEIEARVDEAARIRGEIEAKIERGLEHRNEVKSRPMGWLSR